MDLQALDVELQALEGDAYLAVERNLSARVRALEFVALIEEFVRWHGKDQAAISMQHRAEKLRQHLLSISERLYSRLRRQIQASSYHRQGLRAEFDRYTDYAPGQKGEILHMGPDGLDDLVDGILGVEPGPLPAAQISHPEMVHYEPSPARVVLELTDRASLQPDDVFYDLGAGLGQVVILVHLLGGIQAKGVEIDPYLCARARSYAAQLGLSGVEFIQADARDVDYADGTVFYLFTPFLGAVLQTVLDRLRQEGQKRRIRLCTYGPCTLHVARQPWVRSLDSNADHEFKLAMFESI